MLSNSEKTRILPSTGKKGLLHNTAKSIKHPHPSHKSTPKHPAKNHTNQRKKRLKISFLCRIPIAAGQSCAHIENHRAINLPPPRAHHHQHRPHSNRPLPPAISAAPYVTALEESSRFRRIQVQSQILFSSYE